VPLLGVLVYDSNQISSTPLIHMEKANNLKGNSDRDVQDNIPTSENGQNAASQPSSQKGLSRKEKQALIKKANQMMENVWERLNNASSRQTDA
jgi:hypothetical protein